MTSFDISAKCAARYPVQDAGGRAHRELWVPAEDLDSFNHDITSDIQVVAALRNKQPIDLDTALALIDNL
ncbi:MAG: hypothetical protein AB8B51_22025 [Sedimentitalea sp.]